MKSHALPDKGAEPPKEGGQAAQLKALNESLWFDQRNLLATPRTAGLPANLQQSLEGRTGMSMDDVSVHYNSADPAQLDALAFAAGTNIYLGPGQDKYLPHEAWHVVQQKSGIVQPTGEVGGRSVNDDPGLEREADTWQASRPADRAQAVGSEISQAGTTDVVQRAKGNWALGGVLGAAGAAAAYYLPGYWKLLGVPLAALGLYLGAGQETAGEKAVREKLANNDFRITAGMKQYTDAFGPGFSEDLGRLNGGHRWLDGGAGSAVAIHDYYGGNSDGKARTTAVGYQKPEARTVEELERNRKFLYASGKYFGDMERGELGLQEDDDRLHLITDYNGVLTYTQTLSEDLQRYLDLLAVGGSIYTSFYANIVDGAAPLTVLDWLNRTTGAAVAEVGRGTFKIQKTAPDARVVRLESTLYQPRPNTNVPDRNYRVA